MTLAVSYVAFFWVLFWAISYFPLKRGKVPFSLPGFMVASVGMLFFTVTTIAFIRGMHQGQDMDNHFAREQSCEAVVKETAMVTSASVAIGTTTILLLLAVTPGVGPLAVVAIAVAGGSLGGIGGYVTGATLASSFSPSCQETGK